MLTVNTIDYGNRVVYIDNSMLEYARACKAKFQYRYLNHLVLSKHTPATYFGTMWHKGQHLYWGRFDPLTQGFESPASLPRVLSELPSYDEKMENEEKGKTSARLLSGLREYSEKVDESTGEVWEALVLNSTPLLAEEFLSYPLMTYEGWTVFYCGVIDRVIDFQDRLMVIDYKTSSWNRLMDAVWEESPQFKGYLWLVNKRLSSVHANLFLLDLFMMQSKTSNKFFRRCIRFEDWMLKEWEEDRKAEITQLLSTERFYKEPGCSDYGECPYTSLCKQPFEVRPRLASIQYMTDPWTIHSNVGGE